MNMVFKKSLYIFILSFCLKNNIMMDERQINNKLITIGGKEIKKNHFNVDYIFDNIYYLYSNGKINENNLINYVNRDLRNSVKLIVKEKDDQIEQQKNNIIYFEKNEDIKNKLQIEQNELIQKINYQNRELENFKFEREKMEGQKRFFKIEKMNIFKQLEKHLNKNNLSIIYNIKYIFKDSNSMPITIKLFKIPDNYIVKVNQPRFFSQKEVFDIIIDDYDIINKNSSNQFILSKNQFSFNNFSSIN